MATVSRQELTRLVHQIREGKAKLRKGEPERLFWCRDIFKGFGIRLLYSGSAAWIWQHKTWGRTHREVIGDVKILDLPEARESAKRLWAKILLERLDPQAAKAEARRTAKITFAAVMKEFLGIKLPQIAPPTRKRFRAYLTGYFFEPLHKLPLDEITHEQIQLRLETIKRQSGVASALSSCTPLQLLFDWAIKKEMHPGPSPMLRVDLPPRGEPRKRILSPDEIRTIWRACEVWEDYILSGQERREREQTQRGLQGQYCIPDYSRIVRLLFLTGCRAAEIGGLEWDEVDYKNNVLRIPASRIKTRQPLDLPLTDTALAILRGINPHSKFNTKFVFAGAGPRKTQSLDLSGVNKNVDKFISRAAIGPLPEHWVLHDIRRTLSTGMREIGIHGEFVERILNHKIDARIVKTYNWYDYLAEKREALTRWEDHLLHIVHGAEKKFAAPDFRAIRANGG